MSYKNFYYFIIFEIIDLPRKSSRVRKLNLKNIYSSYDIVTINCEFEGYLYSKLCKFICIETDKYIRDDDIIQENYGNDNFIHGYKKIFEYHTSRNFSSILKSQTRYYIENKIIIRFEHYMKIFLKHNSPNFDEKMINSIIEKYNYKSKVYPKIFIGKSKYITMDTDVFQPKEKWEDGLISTITSKTDYTLTGWFIVQSIKVLEVIRYLKIHFPNDYLFIKDPKTYDDVASIIKNGYNKTDDSHGIIFLLTKEFPDIHSIIRELNEGIIFYKCEPIFLTNPHIVVFSNFVPIVYSKDILEYYTDIQTLNEETSTLEKSSFKLEENLI